MHRSRPLAALVVLLAASCGEGGGGPPVARADQLRLEVVRGAGMRAPVRPAEAAPGDVFVWDEPVVVRVSVRPGEHAGAGAVGPAAEARLPEVELRWRALEPWCRPRAATTPLVRGDTVHNHYLRPTVADVCRIVVEGVSGGWVFDTDTARVQFDPGPPVEVTFTPVMPLLLGRVVPFRHFACCARDAHGNEVWDLDVEIAVTGGASLFEIVGDTAIRARAEGAGEAHVAVGSLRGTSELWGLPFLRANTWRLHWTCYDLPHPEGTPTDSAHFAIDSAGASYGQWTARGGAFALTGRLRVRAWRGAEPVRTATLEEYSVLGAIQALRVEWAPGEVAHRTPTGYAGGSLCAQTPEGPGWRGSGPARMDAR